MVGESFRQGYGCKKCLEETRTYHLRKEDPLYIRKDRKFTFSGYVMCGIHGVQEAIQLKAGDSIMRKKRIELL